MLCSLYAPLLQMDNCSEFRRPDNPIQLSGIVTMDYYVWKSGALGIGCNIKERGRRRRVRTMYTKYQGTSNGYSHSNAELNWTEKETLEL